MLPKTDNVLSLGNNSKRFKDLYIAGTINVPLASITSLTATTLIATDKIFNKAGGTGPNYSFTDHTDMGLHYFATSNKVSLFHTGAPRLSITETAVTVEGGASFTGNGGGLTFLNATQLTTGVVPSGRVVGSYPSITGVGTLTVGAIGSGFGNINIGSSTFTGNGSGLTTLNASELTTGTVPNARISGSYSGFNIVTATTVIASTVLRVGDGSAANPSITFASDTNNGLYKDSGDTLGFTANGVSRATLSSAAFTTTSSVDITTGGVFNGVGSGITTLNASNLSSGTVSNSRMGATNYSLLFSDGSANSPSMAFGGDINTGIYSTGTNGIGISTGGTSRVSINSAGNVTVATGNLTLSSGTFSGNGSSITNLNADNLSTGTVAIGLFPATGGAITWVLGRTAGGDAGDVGTYALLSQASNTTTDIIAGTNYAGSGLRYAGSYANGVGATPGFTETLGDTPSGTWKAMGSVIVNASRMRTTLFLRVS